MCFSIIYLLKLGHVVIDFQCMVAPWFRQNFDQIKRIFYVFLYLFKYVLFKVVISIIFYTMSQSVVAEMSS